MEKRLLSNLSGKKKMHHENHWLGKEGNCYAIVMEYLGPTIQNLFDVCRGRFSLKTVLMLADQMISRLELVHSRRLLYRDLKPDNFAMGAGSRSNIVYLFDFGLAKLFTNPPVIDHIPYRTGLGIIGNKPFASLNMHLGREQGRRDDMEALGWNLVFLFTSTLPWLDVRARDTEHYLERIRDMKGSPHTISSACEGCPPEFKSYLEYCRGLRFEERPNYNYMRRLFAKVMLDKGYEHGYAYDWTATGNVALGLCLTPGRHG